TRHFRSSLRWVRRVLASEGVMTRKNSCIERLSINVVLRNFSGTPNDTRFLDSAENAPLGMTERADHFTLKSAALGAGDAVDRKDSVGVLFMEVERFIVR